MNRGGVWNDLVRRAAVANTLAGAAVFAGDPARPSSETSAASEAERIERSWNTNFLRPYQPARRAAEAMAPQGVPESPFLVTSLEVVASFAKSTA